MASMLDEPYNANKMRIERVKELTAAYETFEPLEVSPFEMDEYRDIQKFLKRYESAHNSSEANGGTGVS